MSIMVPKYSKTLDVCMIVRNEFDTLSVTLQNILDYSDRVIVVDTGSTDGTKDFCISKGASVYDFAWVNDFSAARNFSISKSAADWVMWLDADEYIDAEDLKKLRVFLDGAECDQLYIEICESNFGARDCNISYFRNKVFRNNIGAHFEKAFSERLVFPDGVEPRTENLDFCRIYHWGANLPAQKMEEKIENRIKMLLNTTSRYNDDPFMLYYFADLYFRKKDYRSAISRYDDVLALADINVNLKEAVYIQKGWSFYYLKDYGMAIDSAGEALSLNSDYIEAYLVMSSSLIDMGEYGKVIELAEKMSSLEKKPHIIFGTKDFMWDVKRYSDIALSFLKTGKYSEAKKYYSKVLEKNNNDRIRLLIEKLGILEAAGL